MAIVKIEAPILPAKKKGGFGRTGRIHGLTKQNIATMLGFAPNVLNNRYSADRKVKNEWSFEVAGLSFAIWDYCAQDPFSWSTSGDPHILHAIFGAAYIHGI